MPSVPEHKRGPLEQEFQRRFHDAEAAPSSDLWAKIDHELTVAENESYKSKALWYRQLAAACIVLLVMAGGFIAWHLKEEQVSQVAAVHSTDNSRVESITTESLAGVKTKHESRLEIATAQRTKSLTERIEHTSSENTFGETLPKTIAQQNLEEKGNIDGSESTEILNKPTVVTVNTEGKSADERALPLYQTAKQAIAAVPSSFLSETEDKERTVLQLSKNKSGTANPTPVIKPELQVLALNGEAASPEEKLETEKGSRWSLGLGYAPSYFNQNLGTPQQSMDRVSRISVAMDNPSAQTQKNIEAAKDEFVENTDPAFSFAAEVKSGLQIGKHLKLIAGLGFTQNMSRSKSSYIIERFVHNPNAKKTVALPATTVFHPSLNNNIATDSLTVTKTDGFYVNYRYRHITLPIGLQYERQFNSDWFWYAGGGAAANFLVETTVMASNNYINNVSYGFRENSPFRKVQFSGNASLGVGKKIAESMAVTIGPEFRGFLNSLIADSEKSFIPQGKPFIVGMNMSVNYQLGRK